MAEDRKHRLKVLIDAQPVIISVIDPRTYTVLYQNATGEKRLGEITGMTCYEKIPKQQSACPFCKMDTAIRTGAVQSSEVKLDDGSWLLVQFSPVQREDGTLDVVETITDITDQKRREDEYERLISLLQDQRETIEQLRDRLASGGEENAINGRSSR